MRRKTCPRRKKNSAHQDMHKMRMKVGHAHRKKSSASKKKMTAFVLSAAW